MESYQRLVDVIALQNLRMRLEFWLLTEVLVWSTLGQAGAILACLALAHLLAGRARARLAEMAERRAGTPAVRALLHSARSVARAAIAFLLLAAVNGLAARFVWPNLLISTATNLIGAWIVIRFLTRFIRNDFLSRVVAFLTFAMATLNILGLLGPVIVWLDQLDFRMGETSVSALDLLRAAFELGVLLWLAVFVSRLLEARVSRAPSLTPSLRVLTAKLIRFSLIALALVVALTSTGIDLTAFALFTGALGVGIGFGLQKPISNLISGLILLFDRSIKPGDVIELTDPGDHQKLLFGWVTALNARYVSLTTRDGTEWLVPNEDLISRRVINWSYTHNRLRLLTPIAISFDADVPLAMRLVEEAARETPRVLRHPEPVCRLMSFGDSTVNLEMRFWVDDPANGVINVRSAVLVSIWRKFREHGIRTPLAHRDLLIKPESELTVRLDGTPPKPE
ncbi:mechanosensitive ion channel family protein [Amaricoccus solimangrovi]|uniref:Mechanosensitive ion channel n=1 Tax=Amaricoccus solimangrovi TaxID=2589815 RepID=A0A501WRN3_9RHOB|nr:mechanosensitive ion channel domain-containing protein [Amaricoccus solimangrovi]TPE51030.1 mechanosensitive ion channel [Amaricoccus solimangrovi]